MGILRQYSFSVAAFSFVHHNSVEGEYRTGNMFNIHDIQFCDVVLVRDYVCYVDDLYVSSRPNSCDNQCTTRFISRKCYSASPNQR